jgi:hypothetical protein
MLQRPNCSINIKNQRGTFASLVKEVRPRTNTQSKAKPTPKREHLHILSRVLIKIWSISLTGTYSKR